MCQKNRKKFSCDELTNMTGFQFLLTRGDVNGENRIWEEMLKYTRYVPF